MTAANQAPTLTQRLCAIILYLQEQYRIAHSIVVSGEEVYIDGHPSFMIDMLQTGSDSSLRASLLSWFSYRGIL